MAGTQCWLVSLQVLTIVSCCNSVSVLHTKSKSLAEYPFQNTSLSWEKRLDDLMSRLTLDEMLSQLTNGIGGAAGPSPPVERLGIGSYNFAHDCLRGDISENATSFPQAIGLAASFSRQLVEEVARAAGLEAHAKFNWYIKKGIYTVGISCFSPVINIARHPLWGRNQETYGEDPYLTGEMSAMFVSGLQGDDPRYLLASAGCKHLAAYDGPDDIRFFFNAVVNERDYQMTYLAPFHECVKAGTYAIMCSYNRINGIPACANKDLLNTILRNDWKFSGYVVSDQQAIEIMPVEQHYTKNLEDAAILSLKAGCNLDLILHKSVNAYSYLSDAFKQGNISKELIVERVRPLFYTRLRLGEFDPPEMNKYNELNMDDVVESDKHKELAIKAAVKSFVLLKNEKETLPLDFKKLHSVALVGPFINKTLYGDYSPKTLPQYVTTPLQGIKKVASHIVLGEGCPNAECINYNYTAVALAASEADAVIVCVGTGIQIESEARDRLSITLPGKQHQLIADAAQQANGKPVIVLLFNAGPVDISKELVDSRINAIVECFFPAQSTGDAIIRMLTNQAGSNPAGRLPQTWPVSLNQVPEMSNYNMSAGFTYRYFKGDPLLPFGYGLSYTTFSYSDLKVHYNALKPCQNQTVAVTVTNTGSYDGDEVSQVYIRWQNATVPVPQYQLVAFNRTNVSVGAKVTFKFVIVPRSLAIYTDKFVLEPGVIDVFVGGQQPNQDAKVPSNVLHGAFSLIGSVTPLSRC